jgi:phosphatidylinositol glycan class M
MLACISHRVAQLHWLYWAFFLEMKGVNTFFPLWVAGLVFFAVNIGILATLMRHHVYSPLFHDGKLVQLEPTANDPSEKKLK